MAPDARVTTVVNKVRSSAIGLNPQAQIAQTLSRFGGIAEPVAGAVGSGRVRRGPPRRRPLRDAAPRSPARVAIRRLVADRFADRADALAPGRGGVSAARR